MSVKPAEYRDDGFDIAATDEPLWDAQRTCRLRLANEAGIPP